MPIRGLLTSSEVTVYVTLVSFSRLLTTVVQLHTSAGLSRHFIAFSCVGSFLLSITSRRWYFTLAYFIRFAVTAALFAALSFKYRLKSSMFRDHRRTLLAVPAAAILALPAAIDAGVRECVNSFARWLGVFGLLCQVYLTKRCRRITLFKNPLPFHFTAIVTHSITSLTSAFRTVGSEMWAFWLTGMTGLSLAVDFLYYVLHAKSRDSDFELPRALGSLPAE
jgi:hypothetical protein